MGNEATITNATPAYATTATIDVHDTTAQTTPPANATEPSKATPPAKEEDSGKSEVDVNAILAENARLKKEHDKLKASFDSTSSEYAALKKQVRASKSAEEQRAEEEKERQTKLEEELNNLRKESAMAKISKKVFAFIEDEETANSVSEFLYGAEDPDGVIDAISKVWAKKQKELELKYSNYGAPAAGGNTLSPEEERRQANLKLAHDLGSARVAGMKGADNGLKKFMGQ